MSRPALDAKAKAKAAYWIRRSSSEQRPSAETTYKAKFWKLALRLGRLPTTKDKGYWDLHGGMQ